jgi:YVTN family beta-propeller protein
MKKLSFILALVLVCYTSCKKENEQQPPSSLFTGNGVFIINEGNFGHGNGSLSFYSYDSVKIYNDLFETANSRPLGDTPNSMLISGNKIYIVVNNSEKIEVVEKETLKSITTISGLNSPSEIAAVSGTKAYITSMYSDLVAILDMENDAITGYINIRRSSQSIVVHNNKAYIANEFSADWSSGNEIMVVNTATDRVIDSIEVAAEPQSMVVDKNNNIWVLCNGGWMRENNAELIAINSSTDEITKRLVFPSKEASPTCLRIDGAGSTMFYLESGVRKLSVTDTELPSGTFIDGYFYNLGINPVNGDVFVTDAVDFQQKGRLLIFNNEGDSVSDMLAGIIPSKLYFIFNLR